MMISSAKEMTSLKSASPKALARLSTTPMSSAPTTAPGTEPMPPTTAAMNALMPGVEPAIWLMPVFLAKYSSAPTAARNEPMMNVMEITRLIFTPMSCAVSKSLDTARMDMPNLVWLMMSTSTTISTTATSGEMNTASLSLTPNTRTLWLTRGISGNCLARPPVM